MHVEKSVLRFCENGMHKIKDLVWHLAIDVKLWAGFSKASPW